MKKADHKLLVTPTLKTADLSRSNISFCFAVDVKDYKFNICNILVVFKFLKHYLMHFISESINIVKLQLNVYILMFISI